VRLDEHVGRRVDNQRQTILVSATLSDKASSHHRRLLVDDLMSNVSHMPQEPGGLSPNRSCCRFWRSAAAMLPGRCA
jgi:superfamily II DNA/RNA helicase